MVACSARQQRQPRSREDRAVAQPLHHDRPAVPAGGAQPRERQVEVHGAAMPAPQAGQLADHVMNAGGSRPPSLAALDGDVMTIVEADQPDGSVGRLARTDRQPIIRDREFRSPRRRRDPSATRWRRGRGRAADRIDPAAEHHLRCIHPRLPEPVGIALLPLSACPRARARPASRGDPDRSRGSFATGRRRAGQALLPAGPREGRTGTLGGEQLDRGRRHSVMASSIRKKSGGEKPRHRHEWSHWMLSRTSRVGSMSQVCESQGCEGDRLKRDKAMCTQLFFPAFQVRLRLS